MLIIEQFRCPFLFNLIFQQFQPRRKCVIGKIGKSYSWKTFSNNLWQFTEVCNYYYCAIMLFYSNFICPLYVGFIFNLISEIKNTKNCRKFLFLKSSLKLHRNFIHFHQNPRRLSDENSPKKVEASAHEMHFMNSH